MRSTRRGDSWWRKWGLLAALALAILAAGLYLGRVAGEEALVREGICRQLLAGQTAGRQGVVSSIWWAPFPTLVLLPVVFLLPVGWAGLGGPCVAALFGAGTLLLIEQALRMWGAGRWRWLLAAGVGCNPLFLEHCWRGSSLSMMTCLTVLILYSVTTWVRERRLGDLIWFAFGSALLLGTSCEMGGWVLATVVALAVEEWRRRVAWRERQAVLTIALLPTVYVLILWLLMCWLIMGDPFYAVRSLAMPGPGPGDAFVGRDRMWWGYAILSTLVAIGLAQALRRHDRSGVCLTMLGLMLPGIAGLLAWRNLLWDEAPLLFALYPAAALVVGYGCVRGGTALCERGGWHWGVAGLPLAIGLAALLATPAAPRRGVVPEAGGYAGPSWLSGLERHVRVRTPYAKVFISGFGSFALLSPEARPVFEPALDFNFDKAKRDYYGHVLYLLVRRPDRRSAMDSIHWKYRDIYVQGAQDTLYDSDWNEWRLFELVQANAPK